MINHKLLFSILVLVAILLAGCNPISEAELNRSLITARMKSLDACIAQGGVPIISSWGNWMTDCKFPTKEIKK